MKKKLSIAFIWHMHQPAYRTGPEEIYLMPWVRLHAVKDYLDMLVMMDKFPGLKLNFNLVPVLVDAIYNYGFRGAHDIYSKLTITPVEELGSKDYIQKQLLEDKLIPLIRTLQKEHEKRLQWNIPIFVRQGEAYQKIKKRVRLVATTRMSVLILGENGTGKEHIAQHIHQQSKLADKPFVAVDCGALSPSLIQSAFFGHVKGAFTGAEANKTGYFLEADGGTLFLDEVGNLTMEMQQMLLRAIQERRYRPVGAKEDKTANVRIVAATNEDLQKAVTEKRFRQDLLYRLQEYVITMPPLRDCPEDIMPLAEFFREMANRELEREVKGFAASARNALLAHAWPGNVRELKQKIQTAVLQSEGDMITEADLELDNEPSATSACFTLKSGDEERGRILRALKQAAGNKKMAAKILGIGRTTLYNKLVEYGLNEEN